MNVNKQERTLIPGMLILMSGGMKLMESSFVEFGTLSTRQAWFAGCIIGALLGAVVVPFVLKKIPFIVAGALVTVGGIICTASKDLSAITASNWLDGIAFGMTVLMFIIVAGENSDSDRRGKMASTEALAVSTGILIYSVFLADFNHKSAGTSFTEVQTQGVCSIIFGLASCGLSFLFFIETPVYYLMKGEQTEAVNVLTVLHNEATPSPETYNILEEVKEHVQYGESKSIQQHIVDGLLPLAKIVVVRVFTVLTMVAPIPSAYAIASLFGYKISYGILFFGLTRWIGTFVGQFVLIDKIGRKKTLSICSLITGILFILVGRYYDTDIIPLITDASPMTASATFILIANFFCGMSQNVSSVYLSEAFAPPVKSGMICAAVLIENLVVIIVFAAMQNSTTVVPNFIVIGIFQILLAVMAVTVLPETKNRTLQRALESLQGMVNIGF